MAKNCGENSEMLREIVKVAIIGSGIMGYGIAQVFAQKGYLVNLIARRSLSLNEALIRICDSLHKFEAKGVLLEDPSKIVKRICFTCDINKVSDVDFILESITEDLVMKKDLFTQVELLAPDGVIVASNTSSLSITDLASVMSKPENVCGMHFFNPPQLMRLVEVIQGKKTSNETVKTVSYLAQKLGKEFVIIEADYSIVNRVLFPSLNEAISIFFERDSTPHVIDKALRLGLNLKIGHLALVDFIGLDTVLHIMKILNERTPINYYCIPNLERMVKSGFLGRKSGKGFYVYDK